MYKIEPNKPYFVTLRALSIVYGYPTKSGIDRIEFFRFNLLIILPTYLVCVLTLLHLVMAIKDDADAEISEDLALIIGLISATSVHVLTSWKIQEWSSLFTRVTDFGRRGKPSDYDDTTRRSNLLVSVYLLNCIVGSVVYAATAYYESLNCERNNAEKGLHKFCLTYTNIWIPFVIRRYYVKLTIFFMNIVAVVLPLLKSAMISTLPWQSAELISLHMGHLRDMLGEIFEEDLDYRSRREAVKLWIRYHNHIQSLAKELDVLTKFCCGPPTIAAAIQFGCIANQIVKLYKVFGAVQHLIGWMAAIFLLCIGGQKLNNEAESLADAVFHAKWYNADVDTMKDVLFVLRRAQKPLKLDALPLGRLNYSLYLLILKTAYSYLTLLLKST